VPAGQQRLYLQGKWPRGFREPERRSHDLEIEDGEELTVHFALPGEPMRPIHGRVLGPDGELLAGAEVIVLPYRHVVRTDSRGEFHLPSGDVGLRAQLGSLATADEQRPTSGGEVVLRLKDHVLGSATGRVTNEKGEPVGGAQVELMMVEPSLVAGGLTTRSDGSFAISSLWPNQRYTATVRQPGPEGAGPSTSFELDPGEERRLPVLKVAAR
jgi:hypothetical protein